MQTDTRWIITLTLFFLTLLYLNQEVPACVNAQEVKSVETNISVEEIQEANKQLESDILIVRTSGNSMFPKIKNNSRCLCMKKDSYEVGDIVAYFADFGEGFEGIAHQVIWKENTTLITKGINNNFTDRSINEENVMCFIPSVRRYQLN